MKDSPEQQPLKCLIVDDEQIAIKGIANHISKLDFLTVNATYNQYLNDYAEQFPKSSEPYTQRADFYMAHGNYAAAEEDMNAAMDVAEKKDEVYYAFSKLLYELN